jgi:hypothetical protein
MGGTTIGVGPHPACLNAECPRCLDLLAATTARREGYVRAELRPEAGFRSPRRVRVLSGQPGTFGHKVRRCRGMDRSRTGGVRSMVCQYSGSIPVSSTTEGNAGPAIAGLASFGERWVSGCGAILGQRIPAHALLPAQGSDLLLRNLARRRPRRPSSCGP